MAYYKLILKTAMTTTWSLFQPRTLSIAFSYVFPCISFLIKLLATISATKKIKRRTNIMRFYIRSYIGPNELIDFESGVLI